MSKNDITWPELLRWWPILGAVIVLCGFVYNMNAKIDLLVYKVDTYSVQLTKYVDALNRLETRVTVLEISQKKSL